MTHLDTEFETLFYTDAVFVFLLQEGDLFKIPRIIDVIDRKTVFIEPCCRTLLIVVELDAEVHMIGKTDLIKTFFDRVDDDFFHFVFRILGKLRMYMIICQHTRIIP